MSSSYTNERQFGFHERGGARTAEQAAVRRRRARSSDFDLQQSFEVLSQQLVSHIHRTLFSLRSQQQNSAGTSIANNLPSCSKNCCIEMLTNNFANELRLPEIQKNVDDITDLSVNIKDPLILTAIGRKSYRKS